MGESLSLSLPLLLLLSLSSKFFFFFSSFLLLPLVAGLLFKEWENGMMIGGGFPDSPYGAGVPLWGFNHPSGQPGWSAGRRFGHFPNL